MPPWILCQGCGMKVILQADGSCPSCGRTGHLSGHVWHGQQILTLVPNKTESHAQYGCLYLRPFANRFRARARIQAVAKAMRPLGETVAFRAGEDWIGWLQPVRSKKVVRLAGLIPIRTISFFVNLSLVLWNVSVLVIEVVYHAIIRSIFKLNRIVFVDSSNDRWHPTFRRLAYHSQVIVLDVSAASAGVVYEAEFLKDPDLATRLIVIHDGHLAGIRTAEQHVNSLRSTNPSLTVPIIPYSIWNLHQLTNTLGDVSKHMVYDYWR